MAIDSLGADLGLTLLFGLIVAVPTLIVCGPLLAGPIQRWVPVHAGPDLLAESTAAQRRADGPATGAADVAEREEATLPEPEPGPRRRPGFAAAVVSITLPVVLMLARAIVELVVDDPENRTQAVFDFIGTPAVALLLAVIVAMVALGFGTGMDRSEVERSLGSGLPGIASILLIVAAGGGFKQVLVDVGVAGVIGDWAQGVDISPLLLGWLAAVGVRLATGSATVATITAAGIVSGLASDLASPEVALLVLAIGCGSLFFSHVNDAGFWLVKEYFGLTVGQTIRSWSVMETAISVVGLGCVLLLSLVV